ncbi:MAG: translation elongation factor Ts [Saprospiraceae bacterium]|nr:translation elongation factor Ts [Saprospiraceae bacterium]HMW40562.1 translation elongation factor Ts [Saprospiraceae bacterium]HMX89668.1 translation elongation factor Ts [Saprospiraceae bacterium]HMZ40337.1 translation elongation factor Ts [Saprospiraceae bacterium]HNA64745.1 translation elongation factor Ts [Saprospiraceae bacterium]
MSFTLSATDVKNLRDATGAGMMDCKAALTEANGDFETAIDILRKKGQKLSVKRADREAKEGVVIAMVNGDKTKGIIVKLSSETDFVSKNEDFVQTTKKIAQVAIDHFPADLEALKALPFEGNTTIGDKVTDLVAAIGEKIELSNYEKLEAPQVEYYIHMGNKAGVLIGLNKVNAAFTDAGRDAAMQVAAMKPVALDRGDVDATMIKRELEIGMEQARAEGKPEAMLEKIAQGKLERFYKDNTLLNQSFVKDGSMTVAAYLKSVDQDLTVTGFKHVMLG